MDLFEREAKILQTLDNPQIPRYLDYFSIDQNDGYGTPWFALVQSYIEGNSFQELLTSGKRFTETEVRNIAKDVLAILSYLHQLNPRVLHRDIKPSNLILGTDKKIYLVDFGAVQDQVILTGMTFTVVGTSGYAPIEQFYGKALPASDLYALGATIIHLLSGVQPIDLSRNNSQLQFKHLVSVSLGLINWLYNLTDLDVQKRPQTAEDALRRLTYNNSRLVINGDGSTTKKQNKNLLIMNIAEDRLEISLPKPKYYYGCLTFLFFPTGFFLLNH